jgi:uncharacterized protein (TIGR02118 family)
MHRGGGKTCPKRRCGYHRSDAAAGSVETLIKVVFCLRRREGLSREEFQRYWREHHAPLVAGRAEALGIRRYVQLHTLDDELSAKAAGPRHGPEPFDGAAELWFDGPESITGGSPSEERRAAAIELLADEREFIDLARSPLFVTEEHVIVGDI